MVEFLYFGEPNFEQYFSEMLVNSHYCSPFYSNIAQKYFSQRPKDEGKLVHDSSFIMLWENEPVISFRGATVETNGKKSLLEYEMPCISIEDKVKLTPKEVKSFLKEFDRITEDIKENIWFRDFLIDCEVSHFSTHLLNKGVSGNPFFY